MAESIYNVRMCIINAHAMPPYKTASSIPTVYRIAEICQFTVIFVMLGVPTSGVISWLFDSNPDHVHRLPLWRVYAEFVLMACILAVTFFYIIKIAMSIPSLVKIFDPLVQTHGTIEYTVHIVLIVILIELNTSFHIRLDRLKAHLQAIAARHRHLL